ISRSKCLIMEKAFYRISDRGDVFFMNQTAVNEASEFIQREVTTTPEVGLILGSGLGVLGDEIENPALIPYNEIPHFPESTVAGHKGRVVVGPLEGKQVIAMHVVFHFWEGYSMQQVLFPVRVVK